MVAHILLKKQPTWLNTHVCQAPFCLLYCPVTGSQSNCLLARIYYSHFTDEEIKGIVCMVENSRYLGTMHSLLHV